MKNITVKIKKKRGCEDLNLPEYMSPGAAGMDLLAAVEMESSGRGGVGNVRVALTGVWPEPVRLAKAPAQLAGGPLDERTIQAVAEAVEAEVMPKGDFLGSEEYRRAMAGVLTRRALEQCLHQETGDE